MLLALTIDVEEEGLFRGQYPSGPASAENVRDLKRLDPIFQSLDIRPTLLVSYQAARYPGNLELIMDLCERWRGEIGAHLHPWNTPPLEPMDENKDAFFDTNTVKPLRAKLDRMLNILRKTGKRPVSFRMGRWNWRPNLLAVLDDAGFLVDSSLAPMHKYHDAAPLFTTPTDPFYPDIGYPNRSGASRVLEAPLTILPAAPGLGTLLDRLSRRRIPEPGVSWLAQYVLSIPAQPKMVGPVRLKTAVRLHQLRGGSVLTIAFHSSEISVGHSPISRTKRQADRFMNKLIGFLGWLRRDIGAESVTLSELPGILNPNPHR